jgi:hypothetical protein
MFHYPSSFMTMQGLILLMLSRFSFAAAVGRYWNICHIHLSPCNYDNLAKMKEPLQGTCYNTREEIICAVGQSLLDINRNVYIEGL